MSAFRGEYIIRTVPTKLIMRNAVMLCIILLLVTGTVSASGVVPAERIVRNTTVIAPVTTTQAPADTGFVQNLFSPVTRFIPGMVTVTPTPVLHPLVTPAEVDLPGPVITGGVPGQTVKSLSLHLSQNQKQYAENTPVTDPCSTGNSNFRVMHGTVYVLFVYDHPAQVEESVILETDGKLYGILSENPQIFTLMQTAMATGKPVGLTAYYEPAPPANTGGLWPVYRVCGMYVDNSY
jgi:hypothetical protein